MRRLSTSDLEDIASAYACFCPSVRLALRRQPFIDGQEGVQPAFGARMLPAVARSYFHDYSASITTSRSPLRIAFMRTA